MVSVPGTHTEEGPLSAMLFFSSVKECLSWYLVTLEGTATVTEEEKKEEEHTQILERESVRERSPSKEARGLGYRGYQRQDGGVLGGDAPSRDRDPEAELELLHQLGT